MKLLSAAPQGPRTMPIATGWLSSWATMELRLALSCWQI